MSRRSFASCGFRRRVLVRRASRLDDVDAVIEVVRQDVPKSSGRMLGKILRSARQGRHRMRVFSDIVAREALKARGYRWYPGTASGRGKCWFKDHPDAEAIAKEREALASIPGPMRLEVVHLDAFVRFSNREHVVI